MTGYNFGEVGFLGFGSEVLPVDVDVGVALLEEEGVPQCFY